MSAVYNFIVVNLLSLLVYSVDAELFLKIVFASESSSFLIYLQNSIRSLILLYFLPFVTSVVTVWMLWRLTNCGLIIIIGDPPCHEVSGKVSRLNKNGLQVFRL